MELREQSYILAIGKYGSIKQAAESLNISPPTLSVLLSTLEHNSGIRFFDRLGKHFVPTEAGRLYMERAQGMIEIKLQYEAELNDLKKGTAGTIRFGIHPRRTLFLLPSVLAKYSSLFPSVQIVTYENLSPMLFKQLLDGELDFIINNQFNPDKGLEYIPLYHDRLCAVIASGHPLANQGRMLPGETVPWIDLSLFNGERFIMQKPVQSSRIYTEKAIASSHAIPGQSFIIENLESAAQMAAEGLGISFNFLSYIENFSYKKAIRYFLVGDTSQTIPYTIVMRREKYIPSYTLAFIDALKKQME